MGSLCSSSSFSSSSSHATMCHCSFARARSWSFIFHVALSSHTISFAHSTHHNSQLNILFHFIFILSFWQEFIAIDAYQKNLVWSLLIVNSGCVQCSLKIYNSCQSVFWFVFFLCLFRLHLRLVIKCVYTRCCCIFLLHFFKCCSCSIFALSMNAVELHRLKSSSIYNRFFALWDK